jgi:hypothetical protein
MVVLEHVGRLQVLVIDHRIGAHKGKRRLVMEFRPLAAHFLIRFRKQRGGSVSPFTAFLVTRRPTLRCLPCSLGFAMPTGMEDARASRERGERLYAKVYPRLLSSLRQRMDGRIGAGEADVPSIRFPADRDGLGRSL